MDTPKLTTEQRQAVLSQPGGFTRVLDDETHKVYFLIEEARANELFDQWLREQLQVGFDEAERGEVAEWSVDEFLDKMRRQHARGTVQAK